MPTSDTEHYLAVLKASYDYSPQSDDEIAVKEDQILFLIERTDDECVSIFLSSFLHFSSSPPSWWKVKIKGDSQDADTPVGLVPAAYVEPVSLQSVYPTKPS